MANYRVVYHDDIDRGESLSHHGIHGQKWGIRRFQNPDGTLTEAGKKRYYVTKSGDATAEDIDYTVGMMIRKKDVEKSIRRNQKARGKEYSKIANNPENFLGLNKKHANKIEEYSKHIDDAKKEIDDLVEKIRAKSSQSQEYLDRTSREAAEKYGHGDGDDWKIFRSAAMGDEKAGKIVEEWKAEQEKKKNG